MTKFTWLIVKTSPNEFGDPFEKCFKMHVLLSPLLPPVHPLDLWRMEWKYKNYISD
jgi:hypothetical protein